MGITIPDHFEWVDRAAVITAWLHPVAVIFFSLAVTAVAVGLIVNSWREK